MLVWYENLKMCSLSPPRIPIQKKKNFRCGVVYKVKVEDERRAKILGALNGAEAIKDQWMQKSTFQLPTISGTFLHPWQEKA